MWVCDIHEDVDVCDGVCGGEVFDSGDGDELGVSGISEMVRKHQLAVNFKKTYSMPVSASKII